MARPSSTETLYLEPVLIEFYEKNFQTMTKFCLKKKAIIEFHHNKFQAMTKFRMRKKNVTTKFRHQTLQMMTKFHSRNKKALNILMPKCKSPYDKDYLCEKTGDILLFTKRNYNNSKSVGLMADKMNPINRVSHTDVGLTLSREHFLEAEWFRAIQANNRPALKFVTNQKVSVFETFKLHVKMGYFRIRAVFVVVGNLTVSALLRTSFI